MVAFSRGACGVEKAISLPSNSVCCARFAASSPPMITSVDVAERPPTIINAVIMLPFLAAPVPINSARNSQQNREISSTAELKLEFLSLPVFWLPSRRQNVRALLLATLRMAKDASYIFQRCEPPLQWNFDHHERERY